MRLLILGVLLMGAYFSDLQEDGRKRWYNVVADRHWELQQVAKLYRSPLITRSGMSHVEIPQVIRMKMSYLEGDAKLKLSRYSAVARDADKSDLGSDYFQVRRVTDTERENSATSIQTVSAPSATGGVKGGRTATRIGGVRYINFEPQGGGVQE